MTAETAQALVFQAPYRLEVVSAAREPVRAGEVQVEALVSAISPGTEMLFYRGEVPTELDVDATIPVLSGTMGYPLKYGYANVGRVIEIGEGVATDWLGRLVFSFHPHESHFVTTLDQLYPIPSGCSVERAALLPSMETAVSLVMDGAPSIGEDVVVLGQGIVGLLTTALLARFPLRRLGAVDRYAARLRQARGLGATDTWLPGDLNKGVAPDVDLVFELTGNPHALELAIDITGYTGRIVIGSWYGQKRAELNLGAHFHRSRMRLISSQVSTIAPAFLGRWDKNRRLDVAWSMLAEIDVVPLLTHRFPLTHAADAYALIDRHPEQTIQVLLTYPGYEQVRNDSCTPLA